METIKRMELSNEAAVRLYRLMIKVGQWTIFGIVGTVVYFTLSNL